MELKKNHNFLSKKIFIKTFGCQMNEYDSNRIISLAPFSTSWFASEIISKNALEYSGPLVYGTTQNLQNLSQPSCIVKKAEILLLEFLTKLSWSNFSITSNSVELIFTFLFSIFKIILFIS